VQNPFLNYAPDKNFLIGETFDIARNRPDVALARDIANLKSDSLKEVIFEEEGEIIRSVTTQNPETYFNKSLKEVGGLTAFTEYYVITKTSAIGLGTNSAIGILQSTSAKLCADARENPTQLAEGTIVRIQYSSNSAREAKITSVIGTRAPITSEDTNSIIFKKTATRSVRKAFNESVCAKSAEIKAKPDAINGRAPTNIDYKKAPVISFYSAINCSEAGANFNPSPDNSSEIKMSNYFTLADLTVSGDLAKTFGIKNTPDEEEIKNLKILATKILDPLVETYKTKYRSVLREGIPFSINSAFRNRAINALAGAVNDVSTSRSDIEAAMLNAEKMAMKQNRPHVLGLAVDITFPVVGEEMLNLFEEISRSKLPFGQLILESTGPGSVWFHIGLPVGSDTRRRVNMWGPWTAPYANFDRTKVRWDETSNNPKLIS